MSPPPENKWTPRSALSNESGELFIICTPTAKEVGPYYRAPTNLLVSVTEKTALLRFPMFGLGRVALRSLMGSKIPPAQVFADISSMVTPGTKKAVINAMMWTTGAAICAEGIRMDRCQETRAEDWTATGSSPVCFAGTGPGPMPQEPQQSDCIAQGRSPAAFGQGPGPMPQEPQQSDCIAQGRSPAAFGQGSPTSLTSDSMVFLDWFIDEGRMDG
ncbi:hypothetical protein Bbelb_405530 [Branchiostoma belcheri]|nr:hypothetical protein Bbelb_405530 [Branchiostoma belcheri]